MILKKAFWLNEKIKDTNTKLDELRERLLAVEGFDYSKDRVQTSQNPAPSFVNICLSIFELEKNLRADLETLAEMDLKIKRAIDEVEDMEQSEILYKRYVLRKNWNVIAREVHRSERHVFNIHKKALRAIKEKL